MNPVPPGPAAPARRSRVPEALRLPLRLIVQTWRAWTAHGGHRIGAALAYYTAFSMAPILVIAIAVAGLFFGTEVASEQVNLQTRGLLGATGAAAVEDMLVNAHQQGVGVVATVLGIATLLLGASSVFGELQGALNLIWEAPPKAPTGVLGMVRRRFLSFSMVLVIGFLLLVSLVVSAALSGLDGVLGGLISSPWVAQAINVLVSIVVTTSLFALIYKVLPDVRTSWRDVGVGALITALLFAIGKLLIGLYLGNSGLASAYGAAGSFAVMLAWIYYSAQLILFGAEFTHVYARRNEPLPAAGPAGAP